MTCNTINLTDIQFLENCKEFRTDKINAYESVIRNLERDLAKERLFIHQNKNKVNKLGAAILENKRLLKKELTTRADLIQQLEIAIRHNRTSHIATLREMIDNEYFRETREKRAAEEAKQREIAERRQAWADRRREYFERRQEYFDRMNQPRVILVPFGGQKRKYWR